ncbi:MAG: hypothetical protein VX733_12725 [Candidatus Latescibacterota bacterium]|nr:hypothetical protein [Candidatus Latescibacterota bacterium]
MAKVAVIDGNGPAPAEVEDDEQNRPHQIEMHERIQAHAAQCPRGWITKTVGDPGVGEFVQTEGDDDGGEPQ